MSTQRQPKGVPIGGQFAESSHDEASAGLDGFLHTGGDQSVVEVIDSRVTDHGIEFTPDGAEEPIEVFTDHSPAEYIDPKVERLADGNYAVSYAVLDDTGSEYAFLPGDELETFRSEWERDEFIQGKIADGVPAERIFVVEKLEHGQVNFRVLDAWDSDVSDKWDSVPSTVIVIDQEGECGVTDFRSAADSLAEEYTSWANGDVYGISRGVFDQTGEVVEEEDSVWGFIGSDYAEKTIKEGDF